jgi:succinoglycan biosynthesis protein ExoM
MLLSICINTYKRPELLKKLIESLYLQELPNHFSLDIIVVDNDIEQQGQPIINNFEDTDQITLTYGVEIIQNISLARNKAVSFAKGKYIFFIDDDGYADKNWVLEMFECLIKYKADAVFGQVMPVYEEGIANWVKETDFFQYLVQQSGEVSQFVRTTNALVKAELIKGFDEPFDPRLGITGGEDVDLFKKIEVSGANFIFCKEGIVYDWIPKTRANLNWMLKRSFRSGSTVTQNRLRYKNNKALRYFYFLTKYIIYLIISTILFFVFSFNQVKRNHWLLKISGNLGHLATLVNVEYKEYKSST